MSDTSAVTKKLIERYDYCGALQLMKNTKGMSHDAIEIVDMCRNAINFDFISAGKCLDHLSGKAKESDTFHKIKSNVNALIEGDPDALFSELLENVKFQIVNEEYIDFLGRVYRFKEAIYKYMFIRAHLKNKSFSFHIRFMQKKEILKILRNHYKIYNHNLVWGINTYFKKYPAKNKAVDETLKVLNAQKMNQLIELRHESLIGHGFRGVNLEQIREVYGNPYEVLDDFKACLQMLGVEIYTYKYSEVNHWIFSMMD